MKLYEKIINHINNTDKSIPFTINFSINNVNSKDFVKMLEEKEVYISTKTSCCPDNTPSKLVYALTKDKSLALTSVRVSFSYLTTKEEIEKFLKIFDDIDKLKNDKRLYEVGSYD